MTLARIDVSTEARNRNLTTNLRGRPCRGRPGLVFVFPILREEFKQQNEYEMARALPSDEVGFFSPYLFYISCYADPDGEHIWPPMSSRSREPHSSDSGIECSLCVVVIPLNDPQHILNMVNIVGRGDDTTCVEMSNKQRGFAQ